MAWARQTKIVRKRTVIRRRVKRNGTKKVRRRRKK